MVRAKAYYASHEECPGLTFSVSSYYHSRNSQGVCLLTDNIPYGIRICV